MRVEERVFRIEGTGWYVRTPISPEGPFDTLDEALSYLALLEKVSAARIACSYLGQADELHSIGPTGLGWVRQDKQKNAA
ncbi:MAG: hypothetical protein ACE5H7_01415 [Acidiferrobacterales bacterium]